MTVTIDMVRYQLSTIGTERIPDEAVRQQIDIAEELIESASKKYSPETDTAVLLVSATLCLQQYIETVHREVGTEPTQMVRLIEYFREISDVALRQIGVYDFWGRKDITSLPSVAAVTPTELEVLR